MANTRHISTLIFSIILLFSINVSADRVINDDVQITGSLDVPSASITTETVGTSNTTTSNTTTENATTANIIDGNVTNLLASGSNREGITNDITTTGASASVSPVTPIIRLANASLVSISSISSPLSGKSVTVINNTGAVVTILNDAGSPAANGIKTGSGGDISLDDESSALLKYDSTELRWMIIGGAGSSSGAVTGPGSSVDSQIALFDGVTGQAIKAATGSGFVKASSGVYSTSATVNAATELSGIAPVANGGTGASSFTANNVLIGNGTGAILGITNGTSGQVLTSNGVSAPTWQDPTANKIRMSATRNTTQAIPGTGVDTTVIFNSDNDPATIYDPLTGIATINKTSMYCFYANVTLSGSAAWTTGESAVIYVKLNGTAVLRGIYTFGFNTGTGVVPPAGPVLGCQTLLVGDQLRVDYYNDTGVSINVNGVTSDNTFIIWEQ